MTVALIHGFAVGTFDSHRMSGGQPKEPLKAAHCHSPHQSLVATNSHHFTPFHHFPSPLIFSFAIVDPQLPALFFFCSAVAVSQAAPCPEIEHGQQENS